MPTILTTSSEQAAEVAARLLTAAGDHPDRVKISTAASGGIAFDVDDDLAAAAGAGTDAASDTGEQQPTDPPAAEEEPARSGLGSSVEAWAAWNRDHGLDVDPDATRKDLIAQWDNHTASQE